MYLKKIEIQNIRCITEFQMNFENPAGWHVLIGDNGSGKSSVIRSIALALMGPNEVKALPFELASLKRVGTDEKSEVKVELSLSSYEPKNPFELYQDSQIIGFYFNPDNLNVSYFLGDQGIGSVWLSESGYFSCGFGPYRRFTGGEKKWNKQFISSPRADAFKTVFSEEIPLSNTIDWLIDLQIKALEQSSDIQTGKGNEGKIIDNLKLFINETGLLPQSTKLNKINSDGIFFHDGNGISIDITQLSDGYRSVLSLSIELIRQMIHSYGAHQVFKGFDEKIYSINLPGVVLVDEIDAHLHPSWQSIIGDWFVKTFPAIQFIVTTHSPLICRAAERGSIWRLTAPGSEIESGEVVGIDKERLILGDVLDAFGTELFGRNITQSYQGQKVTEKLARLNLKSFRHKLTESEQNELQQLKRITSQIRDARTQN